MIAQSTEEQDDDSSYPSEGTEVPVVETDGESAVSGELFSPLRLYCSLAPPKTPLPWLLAAIDEQPDRVALVGNRPLCDEVQDPLLFEYDTLRLRVPGIQAGGGPLTISRPVAEGSASMGIAALIRIADRFKGKKVVLVICGRNIDLEKFKQIIS